MDYRGMLQRIRKVLADPEFLADTTSMILFSWIVGLILEVGIADMTWEQSIQTRMLGMFCNFFTGGLNGKWLNKVRGRFEAEKHWMRGFGADVTAFVTFQAILYAINLTIAGANPWQIAKAVGSAALFCGIAGKPYGWFTDLFRYLFISHHHCDRV